MKKIEIDFTIQSVDTRNSFTTIGEYKNNRIKFFDNEKNTNYIIFHKDIIEYYKKGSVDMKYKFDLSNTTKGEYTMSGYKFIFEIKTRKLLNEDNMLQVEYDLFQDKELVNKTELNIKYTFIKEEH